MTGQLDLRGIFPPIPTPFDEGSSIAFDRLEANLERWNEEPLQGYVVGGSNGEFVSMTPDERVETVARVRQWAPKDRLVIAGASMHATHATRELIDRMAEAGADAALVITPSYYKAKMDRATLTRYYLDVAEHSPLPVLVYNVPANTGVNIDAGTVLEIASHPNIVGMKDSSGDVSKIGQIAYALKGEFQILAGSAGFFLGALAMGAVGLVAALANIAPVPLAEILTRFRSGDLPAAARIQGRLVEANTAVTARFGVPGLKAAMDFQGRYGGPPRRPLLPLRESDRAILKRILQSAGLL